LWKGGQQYSIRVVTSSMRKASGRYFGWYPSRKLYDPSRTEGSPQDRRRPRPRGAGITLPLRAPTAVLERPSLPRPRRKGPAAAAAPLAGGGQTDVVLDPLQLPHLRERRILEWGGRFRDDPTYSHGPSSPAVSTGVPNSPPSSVGPASSGPAGSGVGSAAPRHSPDRSEVPSGQHSPDRQPRSPQSSATSSGSPQLDRHQACPSWQTRAACGVHTQAPEGGRHWVRPGATWHGHGKVPQRGLLTPCGRFPGSKTW
jgi:hypothetical protein